MSANVAKQHFCCVIGHEAAQMQIISDFVMSALSLVFVCS